MIDTRFNKMHFGLYDKKGSIFVDYIWSTSFSDVYRHFHFLVNQPNTILNLYSDDFCVFILGSIDDETGEYEPCDRIVVHECADLLLDEVAAHDAAHAAAHDAAHAADHAAAHDAAHAAAHAAAHDAAQEVVYEVSH